MNERPMFGVVTAEMEALLVPHVQGKVVWDLGAGNLWHAQMLLRLGALRVVAVEKECLPRGIRDPRVEVLHARFDEVVVPRAGIDVAYLSWPVNHDHIPGLEALLSRSHKVVYLGSNVGGTACGGSDLMWYLASREVLGHVPHEQNSLAVYGEGSAMGRALLPEEWAALHPERVWTLDEAAEAAYSEMAGCNLAK